jgi:hypothetical protein
MMTTKTQGQAIGATVGYIAADNAGLGSSDTLVLSFASSQIYPQVGPLAIPILRSIARRFAPSTPAAPPDIVQDGKGPVVNLLRQRRRRAEIGRYGAEAAEAADVASSLAESVQVSVDQISSRRDLAADKAKEAKDKSDDAVAAARQASGAAKETLTVAAAEAAKEAEAAALELAELEEALKKEQKTADALEKAAKGFRAAADAVRMVPPVDSSAIR